MFVNRHLSWWKRASSIGASAICTMKVTYVQKSVFTPQVMHAPPIRCSAQKWHSLAPLNSIAPRRRSSACGQENDSLSCPGNDNSRDAQNDTFSAPSVDHECLKCSVPSAPINGAFDGVTGLFPDSSGRSSRATSLTSSDRFNPLRHSPCCLIPTIQRSTFTADLFFSL
jgi:hypothetical protein